MLYVTHCLAWLKCPILTYFTCTCGLGVRPLIRSRAYLGCGPPSNILCSAPAWGRDPWVQFAEPDFKVNLILHCGKCRYLSRTVSYNKYGMDVTDVLDAVQSFMLQSAHRCSDCTFLRVQLKIGEGGYQKESVLLWRYSQTRGLAASFFGFIDRTQVRTRTHTHTHTHTHTRLAPLNKW